MQLDPVLAPVGSGLRSVFLDPAAIFHALIPSVRSWPSLPLREQRSGPACMCFLPKGNSGPAGFLDNLRLPPPASVNMPVSPARFRHAKWRASWFNTL